MHTIEGVNFQLSEEHLAVRDAARDFAQNDLLPGVIERDIHTKFPKEEIKKMQKENELSDDEKAKLKKIEEIILIKEAWTFIKNSSSLPNNINNDNNNKLEEEPKLNEEVIIISNNHFSIMLKNRKSVLKHPSTKILYHVYFYLFIG